MELMNFEYDFSENIAGNYLDTESVSHTTNGSLYQAKIRLLPFAEVYYIKSILVNPLKFAKQSLVLAIKLGTYLYKYCLT